MVTWLHLLALLVPNAALAQATGVERYFPLEVGNRWEYEGLSREGNVDGYHRWRVVADTTLDGEVGHVVVQESLDLDGSLTGTARCAFARSVGDDGYLYVSVRHVVRRCLYPFTQILWGGPEGFWIGPPTAPPATVEIGSIAYPLGGVTHNETTDQCCDGFAMLTSWESGFDVGLLGWEWIFHDPYVGESYIRMRLAYAEVGERVYGVSPVGIDPPAEAPAAVVLEPAYPNPFRASTTLTFLLPSAGAATVDAFDALGRRRLARDLGVLAAGRHPVDLDGSVWAPGVYVVRLTAAGGGAVTQRVVRAR